MLPNLVFIGGGGGVSNLAPALRDDYNFTAILTAFDDGGSSGRLRQAYGHVLNGDIRRAFSYLGRNELAKISEHRFTGGDVAGHTLGNLLLTAAYQHFSDHTAALKYLHQLFAVPGHNQVLPVSFALAQLQAHLADGTILRGEHMIDEPHDKSALAIEKIWLEPAVVAPAPGVLEAIKQADFIVLGPGDLYTSVLPSLLVEGVVQAISESGAHKIYFCNMLTTWGQTTGFTAFDHLKTLESYLPKPCLQSVIINTSTIPAAVLEHHKNRQEYPVIYDIAELQKAGYAVITADLLKNEVVAKSHADQLKRSQIINDPALVRVLFRKHFYEVNRT